METEGDDVWCGGLLSSTSEVVQHSEDMILRYLGFPILAYTTVFTVLLVVFGELSSGAHKKFENFGSLWAH